MAWTIKQNDTRPILRLTLTRNGVPVDTTGWGSAKLLMRSGATVITVTTVAFVTPRAGGQLDVTFSAANTGTNGVYDCEVEVTQSAGVIETFPNDSYFQIEVKDDLG